MSRISRRQAARWIGSACAAPFFLTLAKATAPGKRIALLIASGRFTTTAIPTLHGTIHDVAMMAHLLEDKYGFERRNIWILGVDRQRRNGSSKSEWEEAELEEGYTYLGADSTHVAIAAALDKLVQATAVGVFSVLYYSGHGGEILDSASRRGSKTQYLITQDSQPFFDFEVQLHTMAVQGWLSIVFDCCFAGGATRGPSGIVEKSSQALEVSLVRQRLARFKTRPNFDANGNRSLFYAAGPGVPAIEVPFLYPGKPIYVGAFTLALYRICMRNGDLSYNTALTAVSAELEAMGTAMATNIIPRPGIEGAFKQRNPFPAVSAGLPVLGGAKPQLAAGWLCGIVSKSQVATKSGTARVTSVDRYRATLTVASGSLERGGPAWITHRPRDSRFGPSRIKGDGSTIDTSTVFVIKDEGSDKQFSIVSKPFGEELSVLEGIPTKAAAATAMQAMRQSYETANDIVGSLSGLSDFQQITLSSAKILGKNNDDTPILGKEEHFPRYEVPSSNRLDFALIVRSSFAGQLLLLSCEPDGTINVLYPNFREWKKAKSNGLSDEEIHTARQRAFHLVPCDAGKTDYPMAAASPYGLANIVAILIDEKKPIRLPEKLLKPAQEGWSHHEISYNNVPRFLDWIDFLLRPLSAAVSFKGGVPDDALAPVHHNDDTLPMNRIAVALYPYICAPSKG